MFKFKVIHTCKQSGARLCEVTTNSGSFATPVFMPVGTNGTVKTLATHEIEKVASGIILSNTYHLLIEPGLETLKINRGIKKMMHWKQSMLTDSGGFQVFSLADINRITDDGVTFKNPKNGDIINLSPEKSITAQTVIGADIMMCFDECVKLPADNNYLERSVDRTFTWAKRCYEQKEKLQTKQALFGIFQGGLSKELRLKSLSQISSIPFDGIAIGGLSVGESREEMFTMLEFLKDKYPSNKPRYLMGVGDPLDFIKAIKEGVDMMDCVLPSRNARHGTIFTTNGRINIKNAKYKNDLSTIDPLMPAPFNKYTKSYLHHLFKREEMLGYRLATIQNLAFMKALTTACQEAIKSDCFLDFYTDFCNCYEKKDFSNSLLLKLNQKSVPS